MTGSTVDARIAASVDAWKRKLLDLTKRNRALNFRPTRVSTVAVRAIKPCWMMSPLTVAQYLRGDAPTFDLVIFDEASQLPVEAAAGIRMRARSALPAERSPATPPRTPPRADR